jgi:DNA ligase-1
VYHSTMITRPLLAATLDDIASLKFPVLATPKLDGIRVLKVDGKAVTRRFKPIPNKHIRHLLEKHLPDGIDGEIMTEGTFNDIQSKVMSHEGEPEFTFYVFDYVKDSLTKPYKDRMLDMVNGLESVVKNSTLPFSINLLTPVLVRTVDELLEFESQCLEHGFEGVMIRQPGSKYKCGRSTLKEQILLKLKRFYDAEAKVIGFEEKMKNDNKLERDEFGLAKRSSKKDGMIPADTLGALIVEDLKTGVKFGLGSGFDDELKKEIWSHQRKYKNKIVKYKYQSVGVKDAPRFPVFLGFRSKLDL